MLPARTGVPAYTLTPRRWAFEPRPFRVEPAPFLCAIACSSALDPGDLELRVRLPMAVLSAVVLAAAELEDDDLLGPVVGHDLRAHAGPRNEGTADLRRIASQKEDLVEVQRISRVARKALDPKFLS